MSVTDARREELRKRTRERMKAGEMSMEPEMLQRKTDRRNEGTVVALDADKGKDTTKKKKEKKGGNETGTGKGVLQDDFFEDVDEDEKIENAEDIEMRNHDDNAESDSGSEAKSRTKARAEAREGRVARCTVPPSEVKRATSLAR
ncbi:hypothetical protein EW146_g10158 [Bondarzewia mesenterica]|uniref:Uncharacterized protein n=1 Tax=Bondarzewia mesenterica TaxID=1095465 RepID=A0A4S4KZW3_9AGAM|nr:hypothetical protein EW146_g10158 [Bondarzewia mesenterica]